MSPKPVLNASTLMTESEEQSMKEWSYLSQHEDFCKEQIKTAQHVINSAKDEMQVLKEEKGEMRLLIVKIQKRVAGRKAAAKKKAAVKAVMAGCVRKGPF